MEPDLEIASFMYHEVTDDPSTSGFQRPGSLAYKHSRATFAQHLERIATGPCVPEVVTDIDRSRSGRHLLLTFDDGGKSALHTGEELSRRGWKGHFFVVTSRLGSRGFLDRSDIKHLRSCGHLIGSHSHTHPDIFRDQAVERMKEEWNISSTTLGDILGEPCIAASVPGGDISPEVLWSADRAGLLYLFTSEPWLHPRTVGGCLVLGRFAVKSGTAPRRVQNLAHFRGWNRARLSRQWKVVARWSLPPLYRLYVKLRTREYRPGTHIGMT